jgi:hypothetical protein
MIVETFDSEFKSWLYSSGVNIDNGIFELKFNSPQNFAAYRQSELDTARVGIFSQLQQVPYLSKRFAMKRFLGMTQEEIVENETLWKEENKKNVTPEIDAGSELRAAGLTPGSVGGALDQQNMEAPMEAPPEGEAPAAEAEPTEVVTP